MRYFIPKNITIDTTNVAENDYPEWDSSGNTTYNVDDFVIRSSIHKVFKCAVSNSSTTPPEDDTTNWVDWGATNAYKVVDNYVNTQTENSDKVEFSFTIPDACDSIALFNLQGTDIVINMTDTDGNNIFTKTINLDVTDIADWGDYFFEEFSFRVDAYTTIPIYKNITYTITVNNQDDIAKIGMVVIGKSRDLGATLYGVSVGILDYSKKDTDEWGNTTLVKRQTAKKADCTLMIPTGNVDIVEKRLEDIAGTPIMWIGDEREDGFGSLLIYGFYRDFNVTIQNPINSECNLNIEGLI